MKIVCTKEEKENLLIALLNSKTVPCPMTSTVQGEMACFIMGNCKRCYENNIEWEVTDEKYEK